VKRIPGESESRFLAIEAAISCAVGGLVRVGEDGFPLSDDEPSIGSAPGNEKPVIVAEIRRMRRLLQRRVRKTRAGRECHVRLIVPMTRMTRLEVIMCKGGRVKRIHSGVTTRIRMKRFVSAGRVVTVVAVTWVERNSVSDCHGSSKILQREVKSFSSSMISSRLLWCRMLAESTRLCPFSLAHPVEERGENLRLYMAIMSATTAINGPAHLITASP